MKKYIKNLQDKQIIDELCPRNKEIDNLTYMMYVDIETWLEADSFMSTYKMSRSSGIEIRMPFVDEDIFEFAFSIPADYKIKGEMNKYVLRKAAENVLPNEIAYYKKRGFVTPIRKWMYSQHFIDEFNKSIKHANNILN